MSSTEIARPPACEWTKAQRGSLLRNIHQASHKVYLLPNFSELQYLGLHSFQVFFSVPLEKNDHSISPTMQQHGKLQLIHTPELNLLISDVSTKTEHELRR